MAAPERLGRPRSPRELRLDARLNGELPPAGAEKIQDNFHAVVKRIDQLVRQRRTLRRRSTNASLTGALPGGVLPITAP